MAGVTLQKVGAFPPFKLMQCAFTEQIFPEHLLHAGSVLRVHSAHLSDTSLREVMSLYGHLITASCL